MRVSRELLKEKLNIVGKAFNSKASMPCYSGVLFKNEHIVVSNGYQAIETEIVSLDGNYIECLVPYKTLNEIVNKLKNDEMDFTIDDSKLIVKSGKSKYNIVLMGVEAYPNISFEYEDLPTKFLSAKEFKEIIDSVSFAASKEDKKPILKGVNFKYVDGKLICSSTDAFRLAQYKRDFEIGFNFTILADDLDNIYSIINDDEEILVSYTGNSLMIEFGTTIYKTTLLDGEYPNIDRIVNCAMANSVKVDKNDLINALDLALIIAPSNEGQKIICMIIEKDKITINTKSIYGESNEIVDCNSDCSMKIACSGMYLLDALKSFNGDEVYINLNDGNKPFSITSKENEFLNQIILPVRVE